MEKISTIIKPNIYYHKTDRSECDFVIKEGQKITEVIQVSYELKENKDREIRGLLDAMDAYSLKEGFIITEDQDDEMMVGSLKIIIIIIRPLWKWLLGF
jgi:predicted AAA+ superfamily ATPase